MLTYDWNTGKYVDDDGNEVSNEDAMNQIRGMGETIYQSQDNDEDGNGGGGDKNKKKEDKNSEDGKNKNSEQDEIKKYLIKLPLLWGP